MSYEPVDFNNLTCIPQNANNEITFIIEIINKNIIDPAKDFYEDKYPDTRSTEIVQYIEQKSHIDAIPKSSTSPLYIPLSFWFNENPGLALPMPHIEPYSGPSFNDKYISKSSIYTTNNTVAWTENIGHKLIKEITFEIGGQIVDNYKPDDYLDQLQPYNSKPHNETDPNTYTFILDPTKHQPSGSSGETDIYGNPKNFFDELSNYTYSSNGSTNYSNTFSLYPEQYQPSGTINVEYGLGNQQNTYTYTYGLHPFSPSNTEEVKKGKKVKNESNKKKEKYGKQQKYGKQGKYGKR